MSYKLSTELIGHSNDVRVVSSYTLEGGEAIITASRDGTARVWQQTDSLEYSVVKTLTGHNGPVTAVCILPADQLAGRNKSLIVTGGQDSKILVHDLDADEPVDMLKGHENFVSSITYFAGLLISVSWDCTLRVWDDLRRHTKCHAPAAYVVRGVPGPEPSFVLTGGADKLIKLWQLSSLSCVQEYRGHEDVVRDLEVCSSEQFVSVANDYTVRRWSIHSAACLQVFGMHDAYVYCISVFPGSGGSQFLTSGEDKTVRVWKDGSCDQTILLPAQSVWSVHYLENGDFVVGSSDYKARVFSADQARQASAEILATFQQELEEQEKSAEYDSINLSKLPGEEILQRPGKPDETKLVRVDGKAVVYQWSGTEGRWNKIGDALGQARPSQGQRPVYQGKEYDYVFDIQIDDVDNMKTLKLPYNQTDDPWMTAHKFLEDNMLPPGYLDQVAHFIIKNAGGAPAASSRPVVAGSDPLTGPSRYIPDSSDPPPPLATSSYQPPPPQQNTSTANPYFPMDSFKTFVSPDDYHEKVVQKLREFNDTIDQAYQLSGAEMSCLSGLCKDLLLTHWDAMSPSHQTIINKLLSWPAEYCFPGLDVVRLVVLKSTGTRCLVADELAAQQFLHTMENFLCGPGAQSKNQMVVLRVFANLFVTKLGEELMMNNFDWVNAKMEDIYNSDNRTCQIALATVLLNYCHCYSKNASEAAHTSLAINTNRVIQSGFGKEAKYRVLIGIGILVHSSPTARLVLCVPDVVTSIKSLTSASDHVKLVECAHSVVKEMERT